MKKLVLMVIAIMATVVVFSQVQRNKVIVEIATGTWCQYCPGAALAADQLVSNGKEVAIIEYHNGDAYVNAASNARNSYYNVTGYPTGHFDGPSIFVGGAHCPTTNYNNYLSKYTTSYAVPSPLTVDISGTNSGDDYTVVLSIHKVADVTGTDLRAMVVLTETNISCSPWPPSFNCMTEVNFVERLMAPDYNGTSFNFSSGDMQIITVTFTKTSSWVNANCKLIAFIQDHTSKAIYNGTQVALDSIPTPIPVTFMADITLGCAPQTINYTDQSTGVDSYQWAFPGGTPASSAAENPSIIYNNVGTYNTTLTAWSSSLSRGNIMVKPDYITIINVVPDAPAQPTGDPSPSQGETTDYTTTGATYATSYSWAVTPNNAGTFTGSTTTGSITWSTTYQGAASIKVQGLDVCGAGAYSLDFPVNLTVGIAQHHNDISTVLYPNPNSGNFTLEMNSLVPQNINIEITNALGMNIYSENGITFSEKLVKPINLNNVPAGVYYMSIQNSGKNIVQKFLVK